MIELNENLLKNILDRHLNFIAKRARLVDGKNDNLHMGEETINYMKGFLFLKSYDIWVNNYLNSLY